MLPSKSFLTSWQFPFAHIFSLYAKRLLLARLHIWCQTSNSHWCLSSSVVVVCNAAHMQRNSPAGARGGPVMLHAVGGATPCCMLHFMPNTMLLCCSNSHLWAIKSLLACLFPAYGTSPVYFILVRCFIVSAVELFVWSSLVLLLFTLYSTPTI